MDPLKVLILEDVETDAEFIAHRLRKSGLAFEARRVETRNDFEREVKQWRPDLILADYCTHSFDGRAALQSVREHDPDLPFIFVSGETLEDAALEAVRDGATDYIYKDRSARLAPSVRRAIEQVDGRRKRNLAIQELQRSEKRYRELVDALPDAVVVHHDGVILFANRQTAVAAGAEPETLVGKALMDFVEPSYRGLAKSRLDTLAEGRDVDPAEMLLIGEDGLPAPVEIVSRRIEFQGAPAVLSVVHDISERKKLEKELLDLSAREQRRIGQDLRDTLGQDLAGVAFLGKALEQRLEKQAPDLAPDAQKIVNMVSRAVTQARALSRGLLAEGVKEGLPTALRDLAANTRAFFGIPCVLVINGEPNCDESTASHLYQIALEAVNNAAKHSGATHIAVRLDDEKDRLKLTITDDGRGFDPETAGERQGTGLSIMRYRAAAIGAVLKVDSRPGSGATVACSLTRI